MAATRLPPQVDRRIMVVVAHPDDETIGAGARLSLTADAALVHVTDGAPRAGFDAEHAGCTTWHAYAALRRRELEAAMRAIGLPAEKCIELGFADQHASMNMVEIARRVSGLTADLQPDMVLTHAYEGGHPDHDAVAFGVHAAFAMLRKQGHVCPMLEEIACYHGGDRDGTTSFQEFLPSGGAPARTVWLSSAQRALKRRMLDAFASQAATLAPFRDDVERFRAAPVYDFIRPPHVGRLHYERFAWGMTGAGWRALAAKALDALELEDAAWR